VTLPLLSPLPSGRRRLAVEFSDACQKFNSLTSLPLSLQRVYEVSLSFPQAAAFLLPDLPISRPAQKYGSARPGLFPKSLSRTVFRSDPFALHPLNHWGCVASVALVVLLPLPPTFYLTPCMQRLSLSLSPSQAIALFFYFFFSLSACCCCSRSIIKTAPPAGPPPHFLRSIYTNSNILFLHR